MKHKTKFVADKLLVVFNWYDKVIHPLLLLRVSLSRCTLCVLTVIYPWHWASTAPPNIRTRRRLGKLWDDDARPKAPSTDDTLGATTAQRSVFLSFKNIYSKRCIAIHHATTRQWLHTTGAQQQQQLKRSATEIDRRPEIDIIINPAIPLGCAARREAAKVSSFPLLRPTVGDVISYQRRFPFLSKLWTEIKPTEYVALKLMQRLNFSSWAFSLILF